MTGPHRSRPTIESDPHLAAFDPTTAERVVEPPVPGVPSDNTTLTEVLNGMELLGFDGTFITHEDSVLECGSCGARADAGTFPVESTRRLEGASDPDDMVKVVACSCPVCGVGGTVILGYGVNASPIDADMSSAMSHDRSGST